MAAANFLDGLLTPLVLLPASKTIPGAAGLTTDSLLVATPTITLGSVVNLFSGFYFAPNIIYPSAQVVATIPAFWAAPNYAPSAAISDGGSTLFAGFYAQPSYNPTVSGARTPTLYGYLSNPNTKPTIGTSIVDRLSAFTAFPTISGVQNVGAGATASIVAGLTVINPTRAGSLPLLVGVDIANMAAGDLNNSIRSLGGAMIHLGAAVFGANAAPTNASVALEVQSTTQALLLSRMTTAQRDTMTGVAIADGTVIYNTTTATVQARAAGAWVSL